MTVSTGAPLSLYHLLDPEILADPYPLYRQLRTEDPVHWDPYLHAWVVTRYAEVVEVLHRFSAKRTPTPEKLAALGMEQLAPIARVMVRQMLFLDPPQHSRVRGLAAVAFTPRRVKRLRDHIEEIADSLIDALSSREEMEVMEDFANPLPAIVTAEMLGVPIDDHRRLKDWSEDFAEMLGNFQHNPGRAAKVARSLQEMTAYFQEAVRRQATHPTEGLVNALTVAEVDGDRLTEDEVVANVIVTLVGDRRRRRTSSATGCSRCCATPRRWDDCAGTRSSSPRQSRSCCAMRVPASTQPGLPPTTSSWRQADQTRPGRDRGDGRRQPRPRAIPRSRPLGSRARGQSPPRLRLGGALLLRRAAGAHRGPDRLLGAAAPAARPPAGAGPDHVALEPGAAGAHGPTGRVPVMTTPDVEGLSADKRSLLEQRLRGRGASPQSTSGPVTRRIDSAPAPLSVLQEQLWYFNRLAPDNPIYNEAVTIRKEGPFDVRAFRAAFNEIVRRHEIWRSTFDVLDGQPVQVVHPAPTLKMPVVDLGGMAAAQRESAAARMAAQAARRPYDLARGPLLRPLLVRFAEDHHRLYLALHHLIFDGVSLYRIVLPELTALYDCFSAGREPSLPEPAIQYADYAVATREEVMGVDFARRIDYWRRHLQDAPTLRLPLDPPRPLHQRFRGAMERVRISQELADELRTSAERPAPRSSRCSPPRSPSFCIATPGSRTSCSARSATCATGASSRGWSATA